MVEEDAVGGEQIVGAAIIADDVEGEKFRAAVRADGNHSGGFPLLSVGIDAIAEHFGGGGLIEVGARGMGAGRFQNVQGAQRVGLRGVLRHVKADAHMALGGQIIHLVGSDAHHDAVDGGDVRHVAVLRVDERGDGVEAALLVFGDGIAPDQTIDFVAERKEVLGQIRAVLTGDACNERFFSHWT